jgi:CxxC motif-containing protein
MAKKRTSLDSLFEGAETAVEEVQTRATEKETESVLEAIESPKTKTSVRQSNARQSAVSVKSKNEIVKQTVYLPPAVHEQLRQLAFEERKKMHDYLVEGLDRVFKNRGLKPYVELSNAAK